MINPLLNEIKNRLAYEFEVALGCASFIEEVCGYALSEDEVSYIALYIGMALSKKNAVTRKRILVVCPAGKVASLALKNRLLQSFPECFDTIDTCISMDLKGLDLSKYDYVFSTELIREKLSKPVVCVDYFFDPKEFKIMEDIITDRTFEFNHIFSPELFLTGLKPNDKENVIREMVDHVKKYRNLPDSFCTDVLEREQIATTDIGYKIAVPHPRRPIELETFVCVGVLEKPMRWNKRKVQIIFLTSVQRNSPESIQAFYKALVNFISDKERVNKFLDEPTLTRLENLIMQ
jgi:lichenan operon transcriptional antiterminator